MSPYIVTTSEPFDAAVHCTRPAFTRRAVATLDEAREVIRQIAWDRPPGQTPTPDDAMAIHALPESGGTVGPLPDGTVIEVEAATYDDLLVGTPGFLNAGMLPARERRPRIIEAYNQEAST